MCAQVAQQVIAAQAETASVDLAVSSEFLPHHFDGLSQVDIFGEVLDFKAHFIAETGWWRDWVDD